MSISMKHSSAAAAIVVLMTFGRSQPGGGEGGEGANLFLHL